LRNWNAKNKISESMKTLLTLFALFLFLFGGFQNVYAQNKSHPLDWLRQNLQSVVVQDDDSVLSYMMTKTYTFYDDNFVVKTVKDFYNDTGLNSAPAFSKVWYKDIFTENDSAIRHDIKTDSPIGSVHVYTLWAERVYGIIGKEEAPLTYWQTFDEPMGLHLYLSSDKAFSVKAINQLYQLATLMGAKEMTQDLKEDIDFLKD